MDRENRPVPVELCTKCGLEPRRAGQRWGRLCHAAYQRDNRTDQYGRLTGERRLKAKCRQHTKVLQARGKLPKGPCEGCGDPRAQNHHHWGYDRPRWYVRLCADCHRAVERIEREAAA
jgi:hypothetical protein